MLRCKKKNLKTFAASWLNTQLKRLGIAVKENSPWWQFIPFWDKKIILWLEDFSAGRHQFSPMMQYKFSDSVARIWCYLDRLIMHLIYKKIRSTFKHIISPLCRHLEGPSAIKGMTKQIKVALDSGRFNYVMRLDIKSYYTSVNHRILLKQIDANFNDPIILKYLHDIITIPIDYGGNIFLPTEGIPRQSVLSPL